MSRTPCYVVPREDGFWYAVLGGRDIGRFLRRSDAEACAADRAAALGLAAVTAVARPTGGTATPA